MRRGPVILALLALCAMPVPARASAACSWPMYGRDLGRSMAQTNACTNIWLGNVATLHPKWVFNAGAPVTAQPAVVDGVVYVGAADGVFHALDAATGAERWSFSISDANQDSYGKFVSSASIADVAGTRVVVVGGGSTLYVLDASSGAELAHQCFDPRGADRCNGSDAIIEIESSPAVVTDEDGATIYVGMDYNEGGPGRAGIVKLGLEHAGTQWHLTPAWKFDPEKLGTWTGADTFTGGGFGQGCGNTWGSPTVDTARNLVYFDTSNCETGRYVDHSLYGGESVFAIDATDGALRWCYSPRPVNDADLDFGATPNLLSRGRVGAGGKDGAYYAFGREAAGPASTDPSAACRGAMGQPPAWSTTVATGGGIDGLIGTPAIGISGGREAIFATNAIPMPDADTFSAPQRLFTLHAIDSATGRILWNAPNPLPAYSGPAYANGIVFMPDTFGMNFTAYSADLGIPLWSYPLFAPSGPPAVVGDSVYIGTGVEPSSGTPALSNIGLVYAFQTAPLP